jgi:hypothetical protein
MGTVALEFSARPKTRHRALVIGTYVSPSASGFKAKVHMWRAIERGKTAACHDPSRSPDTVGGDDFESSLIS